MLIKVWDYRRSLGTKEVIGQLRQRVSMYGVFMSRWKLKEVMIKMENTKVKQQIDLKET